MTPISEQRPPCSPSHLLNPAHAELCSPSSTYTKYEKEVFFYFKISFTITVYRYEHKIWNFQQRFPIPNSKYVYVTYTLLDETQNPFCNDDISSSHGFFPLFFSFHFYPSFFTFVRSPCCLPTRTSTRSPIAPPTQWKLPMRTEITRRNPWRT